MRKLFAGALLAAVTCLVLSLGASADCPDPPDNDGYPYTVAGVEGWIEVYQEQVQCCCLDNAVDQDSTSTTGPSAGCPCPHGLGTWFYYKVDHDLSFVGSVTENAYNARWSNGDLVYQTHPRKYTIAECYGPDQQRVGCYINIDSYYCDFLCSPC